ncbi:hypothetical protein [Spirosoma endophyticum]|uniref:Dolichyl-phosphate-mannose-protein mannosyltransferase n=1 Tax=Spirosoma endophyticum TaxID=662367 RepID=A0A1I2FHP3_9BACT|nr:hypothetical protein [Spirosoma endophyticum]SFF05024.1 hypothetical protein SAMN05216167_12623 [Spirosoma endophyticum]
MFPWFYYVISLGLLVILILQCQPEDHPKAVKHWFQSDFFFVSLSLITLTFMRLPSLFHNEELNPDEGQLVTQAITLLQDPVFGRSVDGTSIGPINSYLLLLPHLIGLPTDYIAAHLTSLILIGLALAFFYFGLIRLILPAASRLSLVIILVFFAWATENDYLHYSSELSSLPIITACFYFAIRILQSTNVSTGLLWGLGIVAGLTPYCKLQTLPLIGMMLALVAGYLFQTKRQQAIRPFITLSIAFLLPTIGVFSLAYWFNVERYFIDYYFIGNLTTYAQIYADEPLIHRNFFIKLLQFPIFTLHHPDFSIFILSNSFFIILAAIIFSWSIRKRESIWKKPSWTTALVLLTALSAFWAVVTPGTEFGHHLLLLVFPFGWVIGLCLQFVLNHQPAQFQTRLAAIVLGLLIGDITLSNHVLLPHIKQLAYRSVKPTIALSAQPDPTSLLTRNPPLYWFPTRTEVVLSPVAHIIKQYVKDSDKMAVWGWNCRYYVEAQLAQGVSENHTQRSIVPNGMRDQYLSRYTHELETNKPVVFLDAVGPSSLILTKRSQQHEQFASVNAIIQNQYSLVATLDNVRVYIRRDRLTSQHLSPITKTVSTL